MHLSTAELARLELMFASGEVRSEPPTLSTTDRMMDAMIRAAQIKAAARMDRLVMAKPASEAAPACETNDRAAGRKGGNVPDPEAAPRGNWNIPRSLEELIEIRRALIRNEEPNL
jgi:hypothetical protein